MNDLEIGDATIYFGDCLELMKGLPDFSIDLVLCDLP
jgi:DNA modification methylase